MIRRSGGGGIGGRLLIALVIAAVSIFSYLGTRSVNEVTGEAQYVDLSPEEEIVLGLQAAPEVAQQFGGLHPDEEAQALVDEVGQRVVQRSQASQTPYAFEFHLLADPETVNAFALPGGQIFITWALLERFRTEGQLAGVLAHEVAHVVGRHGAEHLAKQKLTQGLIGAAGVATDLQGAQLAAVVGQLVNLRYGRQDELESDRLGVRFMADAGYDPNALTDVMRILEEASGGGRQPEFFSTHPNPGNRIAEIEATVAREFPGGLPGGLEP